MLIGIHERNYAVERAICGEVSPDHVYKHVPSTTLGKFPWAPTCLHWIRWFAPLPRVDVLHTFNYLVLNRRPWMVSFESFLPRFIGTSMNNKRMWCWGLHKLADSHCKAILALSGAAKEFFYRRAASFGFDRAVFDEKVQVVYPGVRVPTSGKQHSTRPFTIVFVGNEFFRKGGRSVLRAFENISSRRDVELVLISSVRTDDFITHTTDDDVRATIARIRQCHKIRWLERVPYTVLIKDIFPKADVFVMPTLQDTFGYVLIEAMACGLPIISTNQFAVPEIVSHEDNGYLINLPLDDDRRLAYRSESNIETKRKLIAQLESDIAEQLSALLLRLMDDSDLRCRMGARSREIALAKFDVTVRNRHLEKIYARVASHL